MDSHRTAGPDGVAPSRTTADLRQEVSAMLEVAWRPEGFCVPNPGTYPFQWLWDSCFHALIWAELGDERAAIELDATLAHQAPSGFVPHMTYWSDPDHHRYFWRRSGVSTITQPPMFGHAGAELVRRGFSVGDRTIERARLGLRHLLVDRPRTPAGLVPVYHPWETGCDDSLRWDHWRQADSSVGAWRDQKAAMVAALDLDRDGCPTGSSMFAAGSIGFNALVAWNTLELASIGGADDLVEPASQLVEAIAARWQPELLTWIDDGPHADGSGRARTADGLLALLVDPRPEAVDQLLDPDAFGAVAGPAGVHRSEPAFDPDTYWRGGSWPQLSYLLHRAVATDAQTAAEAGGDATTAARVAAGLRLGAVAGELSEYWHPDSGEGLGARPQTWTGLAICV